MKIAVYLRKSRSDRQEEPVSETLSRHRETLFQLARERGDEIAVVYEEVVSGDSLAARPEMLRLLQDVEAGLYEGVYCMDIDRLGRGGMREQGLILDTFKSSGTCILTPRKVYDLNDEIDEEYTEFETFLARRELKLIKRRLQRGIRRTVEEGGYPANAPYGYRRAYLDRCPTLAIVPEEAERVRLIFDLYVKEGMGTTAIAEALNRSGALPRRSAAFTRSSIRFLLRNPVYRGAVVWNGKTIPGRHPPIISDAQFTEAQRLLDQSPGAPRYQGICQNPLAGLLFCGNCGGKMQRQHRKAAGKPPTLLCPKKGCIVSSPMEEVFELVKKALLPEMENFLLLPQPDPEEPPRRELRSHLQQELSRLEIQRSRLCDLLEQGLYTPKTFRQRETLLAEKEAAVQQGLLRLPEEKALPATPRTLTDAFLRASPGVQNQLLKALIRRIDYYKATPWSHEFLLIVTLKRFPKDSESGRSSEEQES